MFLISVGTAVIPRRNENQKVMQHFGGQTRCIMGDVQVAKCFFLKKRSRWPHRCCCCLSSAISTVDNRTLLKESDSKATWGALEILRKCILVRTVYMTHSSLVKQSYFGMNCFAINMIGDCWLKDSVFRLRITSIRFTIFWSINRLKICSYICKVFVEFFAF